MIKRQLRFEDLGITPSDVYEQMGYGSIIPDEQTQSETMEMLKRVAEIANPRFCFFISDGVLDEEQNKLTVMGHVYRAGKIICRQLRGSQRYAFFVATAGREFEEFQHRLAIENDMVKVFIADAIGSVIAEKTADKMEDALDELLSSSGWKHTNRFSPGYCGWSVSEQQKLFSTFPEQPPCGVTLTDSSLMCPVKSVSGVIGIGQNVSKLEYTCGLCDFKDCYKRKRRSSNNSSTDTRL